MASVSPASLPLFVCISALAGVIGFLAIFAPAGIGVREGILLLALTPVISAGPAALVAVLARLLSVSVNLALGGAGEHDYAPGRLIDHDLDDPPPFVGRESRELAGRAVGIQPMHAALDQPVDVAAQLRLVDVPLVVQRDHVGGEDALQSALAGHFLGVLLHRRMIGRIRTIGAAGDGR